MEFKNKDVGILKKKKLFIFDMDGTIYLGGCPFDFAIRFIKKLHEDEGKQVLFFTNNASHTSQFYAEKLTRLGFEAQEGEIMTSGDVTREYIKKHRAGASVYMVATDELVEDYVQNGINVINGKEDYPTHADIVVTSFDTTLTYEKLNTACRLIRNGAEYISTHPDLNCPTEKGPIPDSGAIAALVSASTGKAPVYFGKPYRETMEMISEVTGYSVEEMCIFGDRLYTDIALGKRFGMTAVLVLSGETTAEEVDEAAECDKPDLVFDTLEGADWAIYGI